MHNIDLILTLTSGFAAALVFGYLTFRIGLSPIVGYLIAGFFVGPNSPGYVANKELAEQLAEVGVILLLFGVGLQFHLKELLAVRRIALPGAVFQSLVATGLGALVAVWAGWGWSAGVVYGLAISVASTVVLMRVLADNNDLQTPTGHIAVGWLVVEDLFTVFVLVLLPAVFSPGAAESGIMMAILMAILKLGAMIGIVFIGGERIIPWILNQVAATRSRELFTLTVLVLALGIAVGAALLFDASMALGAFLAGMVVGRSEFSFRAASEALPMRDAFAVLFFVSIGILFDPAYLFSAPGLIAATLAVIILGKPIAAFLIVVLLRYPLRVAISVAIVLGQIGEFSFILAAAGKSLGVLDDKATNVLIASAIISITLNPILYRFIGPIEIYLRRFIKSPAPLPLVSHEQNPNSAAQYRAIVIGYGPVGKTLTALLRENSIEPIVIELNIETVRKLNAKGIRAIYGDATLSDTLRKAGVESSVCIMLTSPQMTGNSETIRAVRELNPDIQIFARADYLHGLDSLRKAGANVVCSGEGEVALSMTEFLLRQLGATSEQIDRKRESIREELFGKIVADNDRAAEFQLGEGGAIREID